MLYPLVASLTKGQRAGLEFFTLSDLVVMAAEFLKCFESDIPNATAEESASPPVTRVHQ